MRCESLFVRVLRGMTTTKKDSDEQTTDDLNTLFLSYPVFSVSDKSKSIYNLNFILVSAKRPNEAHDEHTRARSLTHTHHHIYIHTYIINK